MPEYIGKSQTKLLTTETGCSLVKGLLQRQEKPQYVYKSKGSF